MPNSAPTEVVEPTIDQFVPYTVDVATRRQHEVMHTALGVYVKSLERVCKQLTGVSASTDNIVSLMETTEDMMDQLEGQYTLFNAMVADLTIEDGDDEDDAELFPE